MQYADELLKQNILLAQVVAHADAERAVPTCPGWTISQLIRHVGRGHRWAAEIIHEGDVGLDPRQVRDGKPPQDRQGQVDWLISSAEVVVSAVSQVGLETPVATLVGQRPAQWWLCRRLHEATVHRADVAIACGVAYNLTAELAADGIDEWLELITTRTAPQGMSPPLAPEKRFEVRAGGHDRSASTWHLQGTAEGVTRTDAQPPADVTLDGPAVDVLLALVRRKYLAETDAELHGDVRLWEAWLTGTPL